jgi:hypothetical protein
LKWPLIRSGQKKLWLILQSWQSFKILTEPLSRPSGSGKEATVVLFFVVNMLKKGRKTSLRFQQLYSFTILNEL